MRDGIMQHEVEKMKKQIAAGVPWSDISAGLHPDDNRQIAKTRFYDPLKAEFDKLPKPPPPPATVIACPKCAAVNPIAKKFCADCGAKLSDADGLPAPVDPPPPAAGGKPGTSKLK